MPRPKATKNAFIRMDEGVQTVGKVPQDGLSNREYC